VTPEDYRQRLSEADFRRERSMLAPHAFALAESKDPPIDDLVTKEVWDHLVHLPDDVALRTTNWTGSLVGRVHHVSAQWLFSAPVSPDGEPFAPEPAFLAAEEFEALEFAALHGYYRQALSCLRNALETMTHAAAFAVTADRGGFAAWRKGDLELRFQDSRRAVADSPAGQEISRKLDWGPVFGKAAEGGWIAILYRRLCAYAHAQAGYNNADFWESNGPVYRPQTYALVFDEVRETIAVCYVLLRLCWYEFSLPSDLTTLLDEPALSNWPQVARGVIGAAFS
jgi:hypothetical protein